jgi:hemerythrin
MAHTGWTNSLETGDDRVDEQHRMLFDKIQALRAAIVAKADHDHVVALLDDVIAIAHLHFDDEEALMASYGYPDLAQQRELHQRFREDIARMTADFRSGEGTLPLKIAVFLHEWLTRHMKIEDRKIVDFIREVDQQG